MKRVGLAGLLAAGFILAACASGPSTATAPQQSRPFAAPHGYHLSPVPEFAVVSRDDRTLLTFGVGGPCREPERNRLLAVETAQRIELVLAVHGKAYAEAQLRHMVCTTDAVAYPATWPTVHLSEPLGDRGVVQGLTGRAIPVYGGAAIARPTVLPAGCTPEAVFPSSDIVRAGPPYPKGLHPGIAWSCDVRVRFPARFSGVPSAQLQVGQWLGQIGSQDWPIERHVTVQGRRAVVKVVEVGAVNVVQSRSISWYQGGETFIITSNSSLSLTVGHSKTVLSVAELVRIADGLRVPHLH